MFLKSFFPNYIFNRVEDISFEVLEENDIKAIIFDMDNTLIDYKYEYSNNLKEWIKKAKEKGIVIFVLTNSILKQKAKKLSDDFGADYITFARKPWGFGLKKAFLRLKVNRKNIAIVGDQIFTDIWGGNRFGLVSILVKPINKKEFISASIKRPFEKYVLSAYYKYINKNKKGFVK